MGKEDSVSRSQEKGRVFGELTFHTGWDIVFTVIPRRVKVGVKTANGKSGRLSIFSMVNKGFCVSE